ncbi:glycosyltransferase family 2 protein [Aeromonas veronii]
MKLSICIPTLNRPEYLIKAIESIYKQDNNTFSFEVCISNNASEVDYLEVKKKVFYLKNTFGNIKYYEHESRIPLDENMHFVKNMASGEYIYFLGDDDFFFSYAISEIELLCSQNVDLAIFNGDFVDKEGKFIGKHFSLPSQWFDNIEYAFVNLRDKGHFGAVLVKKKYLDDAYFTILYGSSHAYGCFWLHMLNNINEDYRIVIPSKACVNLRAAAKNYNESKVYYTDIIDEFLIYSENINNDKGRALNSAFFEAYKKRVFSIKWMAAMFSRGARFSDVYQKHEKYVVLFFCKKTVAFFLGNPLIYPYLKACYKKIQLVLR